MLCNFSIASIFTSLLLAAIISNLALGPLREISRNLDSMNSGAMEEFNGGHFEHDEFGLVTLKIANLGRQMRDTKEIFSALKGQCGSAHVQAAGWTDAVLLAIPGSCWSARR